MFTVMRSMNVISRCQAIFRAAAGIEGLAPCHHTILLALCRAPGRSQEELARDIRLNKSSIARALALLEEQGFVERKINARDKRCLLVYPTARATEVLPRVRALAEEWNGILTEDIDPQELMTYYAVLAQMEERARSATEGMGVEKA